MDFPGRHDGLISFSVRSEGGFLSLGLSFALFKFPVSDVFVLCFVVVINTSELPSMVCAIVKCCF